MDADVEQYEHRISSVERLGASHIGWGPEEEGTVAVSRAAASGLPGLSVEAVPGQEN